MAMMSKKFLILFVLGLSALMVSCGPTQEEMDSTATQLAADIFSTLTAEAPTNTPTPLPTSTPTSTETPTLTPTITSTPTPRVTSRRGMMIQDRGIIRIGVRNDDMYPMNFQEESIHKGFEIDLAIEIVSRLFGEEFGIEWIPLAAQKRIEAVQNEDVDFLIRNLTHTKSRAKLVLFSSTYFLEGGSENEPLAIAFSQTDPVFRNNIDRILLEIIEDGIWKKIYDHWFDDPPTWTIEDMLYVPPANR
jgi:ABC-type amino acid transport substrate-binding protein